MPVPGTPAPVVLTTLAVACAAVGAGGCGEQQPTDEEAVRAKVTEFSDATRARDYARLCRSVLDARLVREVEQAGMPCRTALERGLGEVRDPQLSIGRIRVEGGRASAEVRSSAGGEEPSRDVMQLVKGRGGWRISALAGASPPSPGPP